MCGQQLFGVVLLRLTSFERAKIADNKFTIFTNENKVNISIYFLFHVITPTLINAVSSLKSITIPTLHRARVDAT